MSGRFRRWSGRRRFARANGRGSRWGYRSSTRRRARGNLRAANNQTDSSDININLFKTVSVGASKVIVPNIEGGNIQSVVEYSEGCCALNIFDILRKSDFYKSYANMYDQFRINRVTVKINPVQWETHDQYTSTANGGATTVKPTNDQNTYRKVPIGQFFLGVDGAAPNYNNQFLYKVDNYDELALYYHNENFVDPILAACRNYLVDHNIFNNQQALQVNYDTVYPAGHQNEGQIIITQAIKTEAFNAIDNQIDLSVDQILKPSIPLLLAVRSETYPYEPVQVNNVKYVYPQALTIVTAWDRTGLDTAQFKPITNGFVVNVDNKNFVKVNDNVAQDHNSYTINIGDEITSYSSAQTKQLIGGATFNCTRYLYPSNAQEKSVYYSTSDLSQDYENDCNIDPYVITSNLADYDLYNDSMKLTSLLASPNVPFKPTLMIGVLGGNNIKTNIGQIINNNNHPNYNAFDPVVFTGTGLIRPIKFNLEFDIGVTFRGLRKAQVV